MIPIVIDTNIFFSAIYNPKGLEREILDLSIEKEEIHQYTNQMCLWHNQIPLPLQCTHLILLNKLIKAKKKR